LAEVKLRVADVVVGDPAMVNYDESITRLAQIMAERGVDYVLVTSREGKPIGMVTSGDLISRVLAKGLNPDEVKAEEVMSSPLITVSPDESLTDALKKMVKFGVQHLVVIKQSKLIGVVQEREIVRVAPALIDLLTEKEALTPREAYRKEALAGYCDSCGEWSDSLMLVDDQMLCEECRLEYGVGES